MIEKWFVIILESFWSSDDLYFCLDTHAIFRSLRWEKATCKVRSISYFYVTLSVEDLRVHSGDTETKTSSYVLPGDRTEI